MLHSQRCAGSNVNGFMPIHHFADMQPEPDATLLGWMLRLSQCVILCICQMSFKCCTDPTYWRSSLNGSKSTRQSRWSYQRHLRSGVHPAGFQYVLSSALTNKMRIRCERLICFPDILPGSPFPTGNSPIDSGLADFGRLESKRARVFKHVHTNVLLHPGTLNYADYITLLRVANLQECSSTLMHKQMPANRVQWNWNSYNLYARMNACMPTCMYRQTDRQAGRQTGRQASWQAGRHAGRQTDRHAHTQTRLLQLQC